MGRGDVGTGEEVGIDVWFAFPGVDDCMADGAVGQCCFQCRFIDHTSSAGVDDDWAAQKVVEETGVGQMVCGMAACACEWCVEGDDVGLLTDGLDGGEAWTGVVGMMGRLTDEVVAGAAEQLLGSGACLL